MAWERPLAVTRAVDARVVLFQCPKSFLRKNLLNFSAFFRQLDHAGFRLAWEPPGEAWTKDIARDYAGSTI
jgi:uncharacterized protein YecE (DUF72 family)